MKAKELMIGDWVRWGESVSNMDGDYDIYWEDKQLTIYDFATMVEEDWSDSTIDEFIKPIPLTAEILEKNGFRRLGEQYDIWTLMTFSLNCKNGIFGYYEQGHPYNPTFNIKYVHELQHALRLCRIDKEIEL